MQSKQFELFILVNGKKVREYYHDGKVFIEGKRGSEFTLKFKNNTYQKVLFVPSVDGLSVIDGKAASKDSGGYIVDAFRSIEIKGWRTSLDDVASFVFDEKEKSYVNRKLKNGDMTNCGVIGGRVFSEKIYYNYTTTTYTTTTDPYWKYLPYTVNSTSEPNADLKYRSAGTSKGISTNYLNASLDSSSLMKTSAQLSYSEDPDFNLGTKFGKQQESKVEAKSFEVDKLLTEFSIFYTDRYGLEKAGIIVKDEDKIYPSPFMDFCEPPKF